MKPLLDRTVNEQVTALQKRIRDDPFLETAARREWTKMCRSISLGAAAAGVPNLWLEFRPTRAFAAQPRISESALTLTIGVQAETRIVPNEIKPDCPFPAQLELLPQIEEGRVNVAVPIDIPFTEVTRLLEAQLQGKTFPEDKSSAFTATVRGVTLAASGDRLLISLRIKANENRSWFGFGTEATIHVWGRPMLDRARQQLRLADVALDVESHAAFGLLDAAARAAVRSECAQEHRGGDRGLPQERRRRSRRCRGHRIAPGRHRIRRQDAPGDRGSRRHRSRRCNKTAGAMTAAGHKGTTARIRFLIGRTSTAIDAW